MGDNNKSASVLGAIVNSGGNSGGGGGGGGVAGVSTWNGRSGNVYPANGDYNASQIRTSDPSKNVQQKIDELETGAVIDDALSPTSEHAVENKAIDAAIKAVDAKTLKAGGATGAILAKASANNYDTEWVPDSAFMKKSEYDTDNNGKVDKADESWALHGPTSFKATLKNTSADTYVVTDEDKGKRNGVVPLDSNRKILPEFLPDSITAGLTYGGIFNATTRVVRLTPAAKSILGVSADTMTLQNSSTVPEGYPANAELFYITTVADTFAGMTFAVGDWLISLGTEWQQLQNGSAVSSVNGQTGAVVLTSDEVTEGTSNLYMTPAEKTKLTNIETEATKDENVIQTAQIVTGPDGESILRLSNKNGTVTNFTGGDADLSQYLKLDGNASETFTRYTPSGSKTAFTGNEKMSVMMAKIVTWLNSLEDVAFSGDYDDLSDRPTKLSQFTNDAEFIKRNVSNLANYYTKAQTYTKDEVEALIDAIEAMNFIQVPALPTTDIDDHAIYYVPRSGSSGYDRYQYMNDEWLYLGSTDVSMEGYLTTGGNASDVTTTFTTASERIALATGEKLSVSMSKLAKWIADLKTVCFTASWHDLTDSNELATQDDLDEKVDIDQGIAQAGKVLGIGDDGLVVPTTVSTGIVRKGTGANSIIGNDSEETPINTATGTRATALGDHTKAAGAAQVVSGRYNVEDNAGTYAEIVGNGDSTTPVNIRTLDWSGKGWFKNGVSVGNTSSSIFTPTVGNDLTTKTYVDGTIDTKIAEANLLKSMVVTVLPEVDDADPNILYLIEDPTHAETYLTYKKVLESQDPDVWVMAAIGSTQVSASDIQVAELPTPSIAFNNAVYQYIGTSTAYKFGVFYTCKNQSYYCWLQTATGNKFFTKSASPRQYDRIYSAIGETLVWWVESVSGVTLTDSAGNTYTRLTTDDKSQYEWQAINDKTSDLENNGNGTGAPSDRFITLEETESRYKLTSDGTITAGDSETLSQVNLSTKKAKSITFLNLWNYIKGKITGAISTIITSNLTASRALTSNASGKVAVSATTATELGYLSGVTSAIQTQINNKQNKDWTYVGTLGASRGSSITVGDDWNELNIIMRVSEGSSFYNLANTRTKNDFTAGSPTNSTTFVGFYWDASYSCSRRIGLSGSGTSRKLNVNWVAENGWVLQGFYIYKR